MVWHGFGFTFCRVKTVATLRDKVKELEREEIVNALRDCNWVMARAAKQLGITERMIGYKVRKYGIRKEGSGGSEEGNAHGWKESENEHQA